MSTTQPVSNWWYILPILLGIIGALIAWICIRRIDPSKARKIIIVGLSMTLVGWISGDYMLDPWFDELEQLNHWCAEEFDRAIAGEIYRAGYKMIENECFLNFDDWKDSSVSLNDGTAEKVIEESGMSLDEMVQHNVKRESGLD